MAEIRTISLEPLRDGIGRYVADRSRADYLAAIVALDQAGYQENKACEVKDYDEIKLVVAFEWCTEIDDEMRDSMNDVDLAEDGAVGIALILIDALTKYTVVERAVQGSGVDFLLGDKETFNVSDRTDFGMPTARLEVSGILRAKPKSRFRTRINEKVKQSKDSDSDGTPAYVIVVEFNTPMINCTRRTPDDG